MGLINQNWSRISIHEMHAAFLKAERWRLNDKFNKLSTYISKPNYKDPHENKWRKEALYSIRGSLLKRIPLDTEWYKVDYLSNNDLPELRVLNSADWISLSDQNELLSVAKRKSQKLTVQPNDWDPLILWGHDKAGPFTIIEGTNRLTAYASQPIQTPFNNISIVVGLSPSLCIWHLPDKASINLVK